MNTSKTLRRLRLSAMALALALVPMLVTPEPAAAAKLDGERLLAPNIFTDWIAERVRDGMIRRIGLEKEQLAKMHAIMDRHREPLIERMDTMYEAGIAMGLLMAAEEPDVEAIRKAHARISQLDLEMRLYGLEIVGEMREVLTDEQNAEAMELFAELMSGANLRYLDFKEKFAAGELLGGKWLPKEAR